MSIKGDFISFTYNGVHSTELGIVRTSSSNRYNDQLVPTSQDKTVAVPGGNGTYFFGSNYTQRAITLNIAYDEVTEATLRRMRKVFSADTIHPLIFDDAPYKVYYAKVSGQPQLNYIPFQNYDSDFLDGTPRIYKGEGTINFVCYDPFAHCPNDYKYLNLWQGYEQTRVIPQDFNEHKTDYYTYNNGKYIQCTEESEYDSSITYYIKVSSAPLWYKYDNSDEWNLSAELLNEKNNYDTYNVSSGFKLYNPGDEEADFDFIIPISAASSLTGIKIKDDNNDLENHTLMLKNAITPKTGDTHICFNSKMNLIQGYNNGVRTGNTYNEFIGSGHWFKIPLNENNKNWYFVPIDYSDVTAPVLKYDYLYY